MSSDSTDEDGPHPHRTPSWVVSVNAVDALRIETTGRGPGRVSLRLLGDLDAATAPHLARALADELELGPPLTLNLDLDGIDFCSAAGLTTLLVARHDAATSGCALRLGRLSRAVRRVVRAAGLERELALPPGNRNDRDHLEAR